MEAREVKDDAADRRSRQRIAARLRDHAVEVRRLTAGLDEESLSRHKIGRAHV